MYKTDDDCVKLEDEEQKILNFVDSINQIYLTFKLCNLN